MAFKSILCIVYNFAPHYRETVFAGIDKLYNCHWYFGKSNGDIKRMDYSMLNGPINELDKISWKGLVWQKRVISLLFNKQYQHYLLFAQTKDLSTWVFAVLVRIFFPRKKVFFWSHGWYGKENKIQRRIKSLFFSLPNGGTFLYGNYAKDLMIKEGFDSNKLFVIHNSLDYEHQVFIRQSLQSSRIYKEFFKNNYPNLIFIGRLTSVKKLDMILHSMSLLREKGHLYNFTIVGDGKEKEALIQLTRNLYLQDNVWFYGPCYDEQIIGELFFNADLCVSPGNVGLTAIHSLVFGTPVLTHNNFPYQMPEFEAIIPGVTGDFFQFNDIDSLSNKIIELVSQIRQSRDCFRQNCYEEIDNNWTPDFQIKVLNKVLSQ